MLCGITATLGNAPLVLPFCNTWRRGHVFASNYDAGPVFAAACRSRSSFEDGRPPFQSSNRQVHGLPRVGARAIRFAPIETSARRTLRLRVFGRRSALGNAHSMASEVVIEPPKAQKHRLHWT